MKNNQLANLPIFYTKFLADSIHTLPKEYIEFFRHPESIDYKNKSDLVDFSNISKFDE
jgi:hypothetical protein